MNRIICIVVEEVDEDGELVRRVEKRMTWLEYTKFNDADTLSWAVRECVEELERIK